MGQICLAEAIPKKRDLVIELIERLLDLKAADFFLRGIDRVLLVVLGRDRSRDFPRRPVEMRNDVVEGATLIKPARESGQRKCLALAAHVVLAVQN